MYKLNSKKLSRKVHLADQYGNTYCKLENSASGVGLDTLTNDRPADRRVCTVCEFVKAKARG